MQDTGIKGKSKVSKDASFLVRIIFRKNASFQGEVHWLDTNKKRSFRSSLELVNLMLNAMEDAGMPESDYTIRSWKSDYPYSKGDEDEEYTLGLAKDQD